ncbi:MAG: TrbC/VirB2 family protein [Candidatus Accumulibacter sp.]|jgi:type IV secretion system protein VirB2/type IV secretion system protein PtlA|nr:TrbC/VirB2 family protein [Accumulibacter sp.]
MKTRLQTVLPAFLFAAAFDVLAASGGLDKVNSFMESVLSVLHGVAITVVTISIMWAGYKYLFKHADIGEAAKILCGGLLIGGASELANYLLA